MKLILIFALAVDCTVVSIQAQRRVLQPAPTATPAQPTTRVSRVGITREEAGTPLGLTGMHGSIRWSKELGLPFDPSSPQAEAQCQIFRIRLSSRTSTSGPPHLLSELNFVTPSPTEMNGYYACSYAGDDNEAPHNRPVTVMLEFDARMPGNPKTAQWFAGSNTKPGPGQERSIIIIGGQPNTSTLTDDHPYARVDFEIVYAPASQPRPPQPAREPDSAPESNDRVQTLTRGGIGRIRTRAGSVNDPPPSRGGISRIGAEAGSITQVDSDPVPSNAVRIYIRYNKAYGYLSTSGPFGNVGPYSCNAFYVDANVMTGLGGWKKPQAGPLSSIITPGSMRQEGSYYVCAFTVTELPRNQIITVSAGMAGDSRILRGQWLGEGQPRPPRGSERSILRGLQNITLTNKNPFDLVTFEMVYAPVTPPIR